MARKALAECKAEEAKRLLDDKEILAEYMRGGKFLVIIEVFVYHGLQLRH